MSDIGHDRQGVIGINNAYGDIFPDCSSDQAFKILDREQTTIRYNSEWLSKLTFEDVIQISSNFTVQQFLTRDNFGKRFSNNDAIYLHEFFYAWMQGYDAYVFGCPTYHRDMTEGMKTFLFLAQKVNMVGKMGGAFGSYTHSGESAQMIYDTMENVYKMDMVDLGALNLKEHVIATDEGTRACQDYGKAVGQKLA